MQSLARRVPEGAPLSELAARSVPLVLHCQLAQHPQGADSGVHVFPINVAKREAKLEAVANISAFATLANFRKKEEVVGMEHIVMVQRNEVVQFIIIVMMFMDRSNLTKRLPPLRARADAAAGPDEVQGRPSLQLDGGGRPVAVPLLL